jgi:vancomycin resistance protein YoaR
LSSAYEVASGSQTIPLTVTTNPGAIDAWADQITNDIGQIPHDATIQITDGEMTVSDEVDGVIVDKEVLSQILNNAIVTMQPYRGTLPTVQKTAAIRRSDIEPQIAQVETMLNGPVKLVYKSKRWSLSPADFGQFITITGSRTGRGYDVGVDETALGQQIFALLGDRVNREPVDAKIQWNADKGKVEAYEKSSKGIRIQAADTGASAADSILGDHGDVEVTVKGIAPEIDSNHLDKLGITELLATGTSSFYGSKPERAENIQVGTGYLNGTLVRPRADFSFNGAIGDITEEAGYVEAPIIDGERIGQDVGGGICQVSTTVFRAAFLAGMPILDWYPHEYRLAFYEYDGWDPGLDASILQAGPRENWGDFKFTNATDGYLLVEAYVVGETDTVKIYGPHTGWTVDITGPEYGEGILGDDQPDLEIVDSELDPGTIKQTELRQDGLDVSFYRKVTAPDGAIISDRGFRSIYAARGDVWKVSPDEKGQSPATLNPHKIGSDSGHQDDSD